MGRYTQPSTLVTYDLHAPLKVGVSRICWRAVVVFYYKTELSGIGFRIAVSSSIMFDLIVLFSLNSFRFICGHFCTVRLYQPLSGFIGLWFGFEGISITCNEAVNLEYVAVPDNPFDKDSVPFVVSTSEFHIGQFTEFKKPK